MTWIEPSEVKAYAEKGIVPYELWGTFFHEWMTPEGVPTGQWYIPFRDPDYDPTKGTFTYGMKVRQ